MRKKPKRPEVVGLAGCDPVKLEAALDKAAAEMEILEGEYIRAWRRTLIPLARVAGYENVDVVADELAVVHRDDNSKPSWKKALSLHIRRQHLIWEQEDLDARRKALSEEERK